MSTGLLLAAAWLLFGWSAIDYLVEWQSRESRLKMSRRIMRDEYKETEGSPQIRSRIRSLQRQMRRRRVKADVSRAAVVLTNPTHYAVALGFDFVTMEAPKVLAKGRNLLAEEIKAEARWAGVPIVENPPLARSLYRSVEVGQAIPGRSLRGGGRDSGLPLPPARGGGAAGTRARSAAGSGAGGAAASGRDRRRPLAAAKTRPGGGLDEHNCSCLPGRLPAGIPSGIGCATTCCPGGDQRDLRHAGAAAGRGAGPSAGAFDGRSIIVFLSAVQIRRAVELSVFPTLLLLLTLFRLSLNIASSRRILLHGQEGTAAAGKVIEAFGQFVVGGNYVVGFVLFLALVAIQFLVVSHGAVRTAEVTARFTLDALPGKQMAIDADMNAGLIDEAEARRRRQAIAREAEFYGAMDGAARFNQRDSLATILITAINIVAGLLIGTLQQGIDLGEAARTYTVLTVGDGLVTLIPSLLVSVAGGITLTRANSAGMLGGEIRQQLLARLPRSIWPAWSRRPCA
jgi:type III secretion system FlhB-like substrate exporter